MKPTKHFEKGGGERNRNENKMEGAKLFTVYYAIYGVITVKSPHIINVC
jgi:hypothetical protein